MQENSYSPLALQEDGLEVRTVVLFWISYWRTGGKKQDYRAKDYTLGLYIKKKGTPSFSFRCQDIIKIKWSLGGFKIRCIKREIIYKM